MKRIIIFLLLFLSPLIHAQEEFFGRQNGISLGYLRGFGPEIDQAHSAAASVYFKNGLALGVSVQQVNTFTYPVFGLAYFIESGYDRDYPYAALNISYGNIDDINIFGAGCSLIGCFRTESNFPFSFIASSIFQFYHSTVPFYSERYREYEKFVPVIGLGFTQTFFAKNTVFPFINISDSFEPITSKNLVS